MRREISDLCPVASINTNCDKELLEFPVLPEKGFHSHCGNQTHDGNPVFPTTSFEQQIPVYLCTRVAMGMGSRGRNESGFKLYINFVGCGNKPADVEFVLDSSGSILFKDFRKQLQFTENLVDLFDIGSNKTRVGMVSFR